MITCHHYSPKFVSYEVRQACDFLGQVASTEIFAKDAMRDYGYRTQLQSIQNRLAEYMTTANDFIEALVARQPNILDLVDAQGAVICWDDEHSSVGAVPQEHDLKQLIDWLSANLDQEIFYTHCLSKDYAPASSFHDVVSGLLTITLSAKNRIIWFRPERVRTVTWAGNPASTATTIDLSGRSQLAPPPVI